MSPRIIADGMDQELARLRREAADEAADEIAALNAELVMEKDEARKDSLRLQIKQKRAEHKRRLAAAKRALY